MTFCSGPPLLDGDLKIDLPRRPVGQVTVESGQNLQDVVLVLSTEAGAKPQPLCHDRVRAVLVIAHKFTVPLAVPGATGYPPAIAAG